MPTDLRKRWKVARNETWERQVWWWGYSICGWPRTFSRYVIWRDRVGRFVRDLRRRVPLDQCDRTT